jgi:hypothetical protein
LSAISEQSKGTGLDVKIVVDDEIPAVKLVMTIMTLPQSVGNGVSIE